MTQAPRDGYPHLPADIEPGPQSRRARSSRRVNGIVGPFFVIFAVLLAGLTLAAGSTANTGGGGPPLWPFVLAGVVVIAVFGGAGIALLRGGLRLRGVTVDAEPERTRRGTSVQASARADREVGDLELGIVCTVFYDKTVSSGSRGRSRRATRSSTVFERWVPAAVGAFGSAVRVDVPGDAPYSYEGDCISFAWSLRARRAGRRRTTAPQPLWVEP